MTSYKDLYEKKCVEFDTMKIKMNILHDEIQDKLNYLNFNEYTSAIKNRLREMFIYINKL